MKRFPWMTLIFGALCAAAALVPATTLEYDRIRVGEGDAWRLLTGQIVHWTARMAAFDLGMLLSLAFWLEIRGDRRLAAMALAWGTGLTALAVHALSPDLLVYRGSSGAASALFVLSAVRAAHSYDPWTRVLAQTTVALFLAKAVFEWLSGQTLFAGPLPQGVHVVPLVHLLGGLGGLAGTDALTSSAFVPSTATVPNLSRPTSRATWRWRWFQQAPPDRRTSCTPGVGVAHHQAQLSLESAPRAWMPPAGHLRGDPG